MTALMHRENVYNSYSSQIAAVLVIIVNYF
jgi:hypothetical protein